MLLLEEIYRAREINEKICHELEMWLLVAQNEFNMMWNHPVETDVEGSQTSTTTNSCVSCDTHACQNHALFVLFLLAIVLSVLWFSASDYPPLVSSNFSYLKSWKRIRILILMHFFVVEHCSNQSVNFLLTLHVFLTIVLREMCTCQNRQNKLSIRSATTD